MLPTNCWMMGLPTTPLPSLRLNADDFESQLVLLDDTVDPAITLLSRDGSMAGDTAIAHRHQKFNNNFFEESGTTTLESRQNFLGRGRRERPVGSLDKFLGSTLFLNERRRRVFAVDFQLRLADELAVGCKSLQEFDIDRLQFLGEYLAANL